jgi:hypothetical protein
VALEKRSYTYSAKIIFAHREAGVTRRPGEVR